MADGTVNFEQAAQDAAEPQGGQKREQSTIGFPYHDLDTAIEVATALYNRSGHGPCDLDELAAELGQVVGGAFRVKFTAAKSFNLIDKDGRASAILTDLGKRIVSGEDVRGGKVDAFMEVPLYAAVYEKYKGQRLPPMKALEREMEALGVSSKQKDKARQVFERAARQAGYFEMGEDRLVRPNVNRDTSGGQPAKEKETETPKREDTGGGGGGGLPPSGKDHPLIQGLLLTLPEPGKEWSKQARQNWLNMASSIFDNLYEEAQSDSIEDLM